jgi:transposase, IS5 family
MRRLCNRVLDKSEWIRKRADTADSNRIRFLDTRCTWRWDQFSGLVRKVIVTGANINDSTPADKLILGDESAVYADRAYDKHERREALEHRGVFAGLMHRSSKYYDLSPSQKAFNRVIRPLRASVERTFGILKMHYRLRRTRYIGLVRTAVQINLAVMAMNIKRALVLESGAR